MTLILRLHRYSPRPFAVCTCVHVYPLQSRTLPICSHHPSNMTFVSNDPGWWPTINFNLSVSYWIVAAGVVVVHDWVLTLGQEIELIWRQRWSLMTVLYLIIRYSGIPYFVVNVLGNMPSVSLPDAVSIIAYYVLNGTTVALTVMLGVIMIARLHAMYQGSRTMLVFLIIISLAVNIACGVIMAIILKDTVGEELVLSGIYMCSSELEGNSLLLGSMVWMLNTVWEVLALCLSVWVAVKHFRELRRLGPSTGSTIGDCFRVLIQSHVLYFASFVGVSCVQLAFLFPELPNSDSLGVSILGGALQICMVIQLFVLGPRLILSVRGYHAKLVAYSDAETSMNLIVFQEHVHVSTSSTV
ncbi:uncharacterized protein F5147DRAFT_838216 [Suillus discolor]|uniref:DUF6533 domain-containing protein n=1 Tax=Suillus discolor TaxID=1912936 RepID=A0A9P7F4L7_9AGAM|nr:uncharacterized protein F5147DRAFT_838216 [Suillus discolor]KAG2104660.1 hypothetical protein F5147DRAFT_838216 [Suillus discolor]